MRLQEPNAFAVWAEAAYNYGDKWLDELRGYIYNNKELLTSMSMTILHQ